LDYIKCIIKINFTSFTFFNMATRTRKITYVVQILFLLHNALIYTSHAAISPLLLCNTLRQEDAGVYQLTKSAWSVARPAVLSRLISWEHAPVYHFLFLNSSLTYCGGGGQSCFAVSLQIYCLYPPELLKSEARNLTLNLLYSYSEAVWP
jgi:hypothetical protein